MPEEEVRRGEGVGFEVAVGPSLKVENNIVCSVGESRGEEVEIRSIIYGQWYRNIPLSRLVQLRDKPNWWLKVKYVQKR